LLLRFGHRRSRTLADALVRPVRGCELTLEIQLRISPRLRIVGRARAANFFDRVVDCRNFARECEGSLACFLGWCSLRCSRRVDATTWRALSLEPAAA
jgi:hypothetical protein